MTQGLPIEVPVPVPRNPEMFNKIGMLRLQCTVRLFAIGAVTENLKPGVEYDVWLRVKVDSCAIYVS